MIRDIVYQLPLQNLKIKSNGYNFSCNVCGDSKNKHKTRGWFIKKQGEWFFKCYNCGNFMNFYDYIRKYFPYVYNDIFKKELESNTKEIKIDEKFQEEMKLFKEFPALSVDKLNENHEAYIYLSKRKIPRNIFSFFHYTDDFTKFVNEMTNDKYHYWSFHDSRILIPFRKRSKEIFAFQGRAIKESNFRYSTIKLDENYPKIFGLERVRYDKQIIICEGPFDSVFLDNCVAMGGSDLCEENILKFFSKDQVILLFDCEPRNREVNNKIEKYLKNNYKVVLFPKEMKKFGKDINDYVKNGLTVKEIHNIIDKNIIFGKEGELLFKIWRIR